MRILFTIPHYYDPKGGGMYGSLRENAAHRRNALRATIVNLHATFGPRQALLSGGLVASNAFQAAEVGVVVCTTGERHLVGQLALPPAMFLHRGSRAEPLFLGFECHEVLKRNLERFDYFCYLEDDIGLTDPLFFHKLEWFNRLAGEDAVLQQNRFETALGQPWDKLYIDGGLAKREWSDRWQDVNDRPIIEAEAFGAPLKFCRVINPHSGCFFLNARQMRRWAAAPTFLQRENTFAGPLESAATFGIMHYFRVYKPARDNAAFLEVHHLDNRYLGARLRFAKAPAAAPQA
jgi:hypothetical protein